MKKRTALVMLFIFVITLVGSFGFAVSSQAGDSPCCWLPSPGPNCTDRQGHWADEVMICIMDPHPSTIHVICLLYACKL